MKIKTREERINSNSEEENTIIEHLVNIIEQKLKPLESDSSVFHCKAKIEERTFHKVSAVILNKIKSLYEKHGYQNVDMESKMIEPHQFDGGPKEFFIIVSLN